MATTPDEPSSSDASGSDFDRLLGGGTPGGAKPAEPGAAPPGRGAGISSGVDGLIQDALAERSLLSDDVLTRARGMIERLDRAIADQLTEILHHPEFQALEATWRGLRTLVAEAEIGVQVRCADVSRAELAAFAGADADGGWRESPLRRRMIDDVFDDARHQPYWILIGDYEFGPGAEDVRVLDAIGRVAETALCPFVAGATPAVLGLRAWSDLQESMAEVGTPDEDAQPAWHELRGARHAAFVGLAAPRTLARLPYGERTEPLDDFPFEEPIDGGDASAFCWSNAAFAAGVLSVRAFVEDGWCARLGGRSLGELPLFTLRVDDDEWLVRGPTEALLSESRIARFADGGVIPLVATRDSDRARIASTPSLAAPTGPAPATPRMLDDLCALTPFGLMLRCAKRDAMTGAAQTAESVRSRLEPMLQRYVLPDGVEPSPRHPLAAARLTVTEAPGHPGELTVELRVAPWHLLESRTPLLAASFRLHA